MGYRITSGGDLYYGPTCLLYEDPTAIERAMVRRLIAVEIQAGNEENVKVLAEYVCRWGIDTPRNDTPQSLRAAFIDALKALIDTLERGGDGE